MPVCAAAHPCVPLPCSRAPTHLAQAGSGKRLHGELRKGLLHTGPQLLLDDLAGQHWRECWHPVLQLTQLLHANPGKCMAAVVCRFAGMMPSNGLKGTAALGPVLPWPAITSKLTH